MILKTHYVLSIFALLKHSFKTLLFSAAILSALVLVTLPILKIDFYAYYIEKRLEMHIGEPLTITDVGYYNQSLRATLARVGIPDTFAVFSLLLIGVIGYYTYKSSDIASGFLLSLLISPVVWQHYMVITYPILFLTALSFAKKRRYPWHIWIAGVLLLAHIPWLHEKPVSLILGILASHYYFGVLILIFSRMQLYAQQQYKNFSLAE